MIMAPHEEPEIESAGNDEEVVEESPEEAEEEVEEEEDEEEEDLVDPHVPIKEKCGKTKECKSLGATLNKCNQRVENGDILFEGENCSEELFSFLHCVDHCAADQIIKALKWRVVEWGKNDYGRVEAISQWRWRFWLDDIWGRTILDWWSASSHPAVHFNLYWPRIVDYRVLKS